MSTKKSKTRSWTVTEINDDRDGRTTPTVRYEDRGSISKGIYITSHWGQEMWVHEDDIDALITNIRKARKIMQH